MLRHTYSIIVDGLERKVLELRNGTGGVIKAEIQLEKHR